MSTIRILRSHNAVIVVLVVALLAQMPHAQEVFYQFSRVHGLYSWIAAVFAAVALEIAVLVFVVRGNTRASWGFALFSIAINLVYYADAQSIWWMPNPSWLLSAGLPIAIALYSHEVADQAEDAQNPVHDQPEQWYEIVQGKLASLEYAIDAARDDIAIAHMQIATVQEDESDAQVECDTVQPETDDAQPDCAMPNPTVQDETTIVQEAIDLKQRSAQLKSEGFTNAQISEMLGVHRNTVGAWLRTNGYHKQETL